AREVAVAAGIDDVGIVGARRDPAALAAAHLVPILLTDRAPVRTARDAHSAVVLLRAADLVGHVRSGDDVIELRRRLIVLPGPRGAAVIGDGRPAVVAVDHAGGIVGRYPEPVVVAVGRAQLRERPAAVHRAIGARVQHVDHVGILVIGVDVGVVPGALAQIAFVVRAPPRLAAVFRSEDAARVGLDDRPHAILIGGHRDADLPNDALRHAIVARDLLPRIAAVGGLEQSRARPAARHVPGTPTRLPHRRVENA